MWRFEINFWNQVCHSSPSKQNNLLVGRSKCCPLKVSSFWHWLSGVNGNGDGTGYEVLAPVISLCFSACHLNLLCLVWLAVIANIPRRVCQYCLSWLSDGPEQCLLMSGGRVRGGGLEGEGCQCRQVSGCHRSYQCHGIAITISLSWHDLAQSSSPVHGCLLFSMQIKFVLFCWGCVFSLAIPVHNSVRGHHEKEYLSWSLTVWKCNAEFITKWERLPVDDKY